MSPTFSTGQPAAVKPDLSGASPSIAGFPLDATRLEALMRELVISAKTETDALAFLGKAMELLKKH